MSESSYCICYNFHKAIQVHSGDTLTFSMAKGGLRAYVAFSGGGIDAPVIMGSRSVCVRLKFGKKLEAGDELKLIKSVPELPSMLSRTVSYDFSHMGTASADGVSVLRVIMGPQDHMFTEEGINTFLSSIYKVTGQCDRMALRLDGSPIGHVDGADIISDGIANGAIQVPGNGLPMIMACERQTTGGYTKIANVITADMGILGQLKPGDRVRFEKTSVDAARNLLLTGHEKLEELKKRIKADPPYPEKAFTVSVNGRSYGVRIRRES